MQAKYTEFAAVRYIHAALQVRGIVCKLRLVCHLSKRRTRPYSTARQSEALEILVHGKCSLLQRLQDSPNAAMQFVKGDIQSLDLVLHLLSSEEVDTVMHFAAQVSDTPRLGGARRAANCTLGFDTAHVLALTANTLFAACSGVQRRPLDAGLPTRRGRHCLRTVLGLNQGVERLDDLSCGWKTGDAVLSAQSSPSLSP